MYNSNDFDVTGSNVKVPGSNVPKPFLINNSEMH